jgi:hypothetical protein
VDLQINWNRLNRDVDRVSKSVQKEAKGKKDWTDKVRYSQVFLVLTISVAKWP